MWFLAVIRDMQAPTYWINPINTAQIPHKYRSKVSLALPYDIQARNNVTELSAKCI